MCWTSFVIDSRNTIWISGTRLCHPLRGFFALLLPHLLGDASQLIRHAEAHVLPGEPELPLYFITGWIVGGVVKTAEALAGVQQRFGQRLRNAFTEFLAVRGELSQPLFDGFQSRDRQQVDPISNGRQRL